MPLKAHQVRPKQSLPWAGKVGFIHTVGHPNPFYHHTFTAITICPESRSQIRIFPSYAPVATSDTVPWGQAWEAVALVEPEGEDLL